MLKTVGFPSTRTGDQTIVDGNLVIGTAGKGIDFSATTEGSGTMTSELLADYEEGTWTPIDSSGASLTFVEADGTYVKIGSQVFATAHILFPATASAVSIAIGGLPFTSKNTFAAMYPANISITTFATPITGLVNVNTTTVQFYTFGASGVTNGSLSNGIIRFCAVYQV